MKVIYKQELDYRSGFDGSINLPKDADVISCGFQGERLVIWFTTDSDTTDLLLSHFYLIRTGESLPNDIHLYKFIGTANDNDPVFPFVLHVYKKNNPSVKSNN